MDEAKTREHIAQHAAAVVRGDMDAVVADFTQELRPHVPQIAEGLPQPTTAADVLNVEFADAEAVALIRYSGEDRTVTVRSRWQEQDGRPLIVAAEPTG